MKPAWDKLMQQYRNSSSILVADVDCTSAGRSLCQQVGVRGYPTIKYGDPSDLQDYKGSREFAELDKFAASLDVTCTPAKIEHCSEEQKAKLAEYKAMGPEKREALIKEKDAEVTKLQAAFKEASERINKEYKEALKQKDAAVKAVKDSGLKYLKALRTLEQKGAEL
mmetsp:Transcript_104874/g.338176  ORF Transcript_104874/g.338176 Transcript_104874/m.338176 type:complete len:167 (+) Transcript_104874:341-841(+)